MSGAFGGYHYDVDIFGRNDVLKVNIEAMAEADGLAGFDIGGYLLFIHACLNFVGQGDDYQSRTVHRAFDVCGVKAMFLGDFEIVCAWKLGYLDCDTAVAEVLGMSVTL